MKIDLFPAYSFNQLGRRKGQQDARYPDTDAAPEGERVFMVCDGVGGSKNGEVASHAFCEAMSRNLKAVDLRKPLSMETYAGIFGKALAEFRDTLRSRGALESATTMTLLVVHGGGVLVSHIGDSRIYHVRPGVGILYRSDDHSLVNILTHTGNLTPQEAINHPRGNVITRCLELPEGDVPLTATTVNITNAEAGDEFLLCSDGVLHCISDGGIVGLLSSRNPGYQVRRLARLSEDSSDNNTAYIIKISSVERSSAEKAHAADVDLSVEIGAGYAPKAAPKKRKLFHF